jgi:hypothetical protein
MVLSCYLQCQQALVLSVLYYTLFEQQAAGQLRGVFDLDHCLRYMFSRGHILRAPERPVTLLDSEDLQTHVVRLLVVHIILSLPMLHASAFLALFTLRIVQIKLSDARLELNSLLMSHQLRQVSILAVNCDDASGRIVSL